MNKVLVGCWLSVVLCACENQSNVIPMLRHFPETGELGAHNAKTTGFVPELDCERPDSFFTINKFDGAFYVRIQTFCPVICVKLEVRESAAQPVLAQLKLADPMLPDDDNISAAGCREHASDYHCHLPGVQDLKCTFDYGPVPGSLRGRLNVYLMYDVRDTADPNCSDPNKFTAAGTVFSCAKANFEQ